MIYVDPPYGIKYDANFQQRIDTAENDQKDRADDVVSIKAFRIHGHWESTRISRISGAVVPGARSPR